MIENALGYFNVDPGYQYSRGGRYEVCLSPLWPLGPPILGGSRSFSRFPPLSHITRALCLSWSDAPLYSRASWHAPRVSSIGWWAPGYWHQGPDTPEMFSSQRGAIMSVFAPVCHLLTSLSPRFLLFWLRLQNIEAENIWRPPAHYPWITTKHFFWQRGQLLQFFYTGIERFLFVWLALHRHITEKRAADWSRGGSPLSNHCHKAELPGSRVSSQNSHNIIQLGVKTPAPGTMAHREPVQTIHSHVNLNTWQTWNATHNTQHKDGDKNWHKTILKWRVFFHLFYPHIFSVSGWTQAPVLAARLWPWVPWSRGPVPLRPLRGRHPPSFSSTGSRRSLRSWWRLQCKCRVRRWVRPRWWHGPLRKRQKLQKERNFPQSGHQHSSCVALSASDTPISIRRPEETACSGHGTINSTSQ